MGTLRGARELAGRVYSSVYKVTGQLDQGEAYVEGKTQVGTTGTGDSAKTSFSNPKPDYPTLLLLPPKSLSSKALLKCHLLQEAFHHAPSQTHLPPPSMILCHLSLHHSTLRPECPQAHSTGCTSDVTSSPHPAEGLAHDENTAQWPHYLPLALS